MGFRISFALSLLFATAAFTGCNKKPPAASNGALFDKYPHSPPFDLVVATHKEAATDNRDDLLLLTTWFLDGDPRVAMTCRIRTDGRGSTYRYVHQYALQNNQRIDLVPDQMTALKASLEQLPPSAPPATVDKLLIVSYRDPGGQWVTRAYDRFGPPAAASALYIITGAPIQPMPGE